MASWGSSCWPTCCADELRPVCGLGSAPASEGAGGPGEGPTRCCARPGAAGAGRRFGCCAGAPDAAGPGTPDWRRGGAEWPPVGGASARIPRRPEWGEAQAQVPPQRGGSAPQGGEDRGQAPGHAGARRGSQAGDVRPKTHPVQCILFLGQLTDRAAPSPSRRTLTRRTTVWVGDGPTHGDSSWPSVSARPKMVEAAVASAARVAWPRSASVGLGGRARRSPALGPSRSKRAGTPGLGDGAETSPRRGWSRTRDPKPLRPPSKPGGHTFGVSPREPAWQLSKGRSRALRGISGSSALSLARERYSPSPSQLGTFSVAAGRWPRTRWGGSRVSAVRDTII